MKDPHARVLSIVALVLAITVVFGGLWINSPRIQAQTTTLANVPAPDCVIPQATLSATGPQTAFDNRACGASTWTLEEFTNGSVAPAITIQLERADDNGSGAPMTFANWPAPDIENSALGTLTNMQNIDFNAGQLTYYRFYPWVRVNLVSLGAGGSVTYQVLGYRPRFGAPTTSAAGALGNDYCANPGVRKTGTINVTSATTTAIAPVSGTAAVYPCEGQITIATSGTSADTAQFEFGTGTACASVTKTLTGSFGAGIVATTGGQSGIVQPLGRLAPSAFGNGFCIVSAGTTVNIQGYYTYVQQ